MKKKCMMVAATLLAGLTGFGATYVWIEGESAIKNNLNPNPWVKGDNPALLSGGDALACLNDNENKLPNPAFVLWKMDVPEDGDYHVYFRHGFMGHCGQMRYRFIELGADGKPFAKPGPEEGWNTFDLDAKEMDRQPTGQWRTIEWSKQSPVTLKKGQYYLDLQVTAPNPGHTNDQLVWTLIDAICLTKEPFTPSGTTKPGETSKAATGGGAKGSTDYY